MKFSVVAALVVVLAFGYVSAAPTHEAEVQKIPEFITDISASVATAGQRMAEKVKALGLTNKAQTYFEGGKDQVQPLVDKVQAEAEKLGDQLKPFISNIEEQLKPLADNFQAQLMSLAQNFSAQVKPLTDSFETQMEQIFHQTLAQAFAINLP